MTEMPKLDQAPKSDFITREKFQAALEELKQEVIDPNVGLFGPDTMMWKINKYVTSFLGGGRAVLLQTAHPWIANAIDQHSATKYDPYGRFKRTFTNVFTMTYGSLDQLTDCCLAVHNIHSKMFGEIKEDSGAFAKGSYYQANEVNSMVWVHATLWETAAKMYELVIGPLTDEEKEQYYQETKLFAFCFGIPDDALPPNWNEFLEYNEFMWNSSQLKVESAGKELARFLFSMKPPLKSTMNYYKMLTSMMLPERLREEFDLPAATKENMEKYEKFIGRLRAVMPYLPRRVKYLPPYIEAHRRLHGKHSPDFLTGVMNRAMVGQAKLVS